MISNAKDVTHLLRFVGKVVTWFMKLLVVLNLLKYYTRIMRIFRIAWNLLAGLQMRHEEDNSARFRSVVK